MELHVASQLLGLAKVKVRHVSPWLSIATDHGTLCYAAPETLKPSDVAVIDCMWCRVKAGKPVATHPFNYIAIQ